MSNLYIPNLRGFETGQHQLSDLGERTTTDGVPYSSLWTEFTQRLNLFNQASDRVVDTLASETTQLVERVAIPTRARMERATENGRPTLVRTTRVSRGYPIAHYDIGYGATQEFLDDADADTVRGAITTIEEAYRYQRRKIIYEALFGNTNYTDQDGIAVKRLYNNDGEVPPEYESYVHTGSHTHYLTSAAGTLAEADITTLETHLLHHGYGDDTNGAGGNLILRVNRTLMAAIRGFTGFIPAESASVAEILTGSGIIVGGAGRFSPPGTQGYIGRFAVVEDLTIPAGFLLAYATGGLATERPVRLRVKPNVRGLRLNAGDSAYPLMNSFYDTYMGAGVAHRGSAVIMQETAGAYTPPTF